MNWIEVIIIRLSKQDDVEELLSILQQIEKTTHPSVVIDFFGNVEIESDWMMTIRHGSTETKPRKTRLGRIIVEALRSYGLVNHQVWGKGGETKREIQLFKNTEYNEQE